MTQKANSENLLIDFNNLSVDDKSSTPQTFENFEWTYQNPIKSIACDQNNASTKTPSESMAFLCSSEPLYKLLNSGSVDADDNNPFDHLDKQACLSDDPFEIVENAALISSSAPADTGLLKVEMGTLISIESPIISKSDSKTEPHSKTVFDTPKKANSTCETHDSVQNISPIMKNVSPKLLVSPTGKGRGKAKSTSLNLLKYSLSNSRLDLIGESGSHGEEILSGDETSNKKQKLGTMVPRESSKDDSFDDIWATKPNLIDSQTDIEIDSDVDNDLAKLNIPMLNISTNGSKSGEKTTSKEGDQTVEELAEAKAVNRSEILEKFASIKQKIPPSPMTIDTSTVPIQNQTVDVKCAQMPVGLDDEPSTPKSQYSTVVLQQDSSADNTNSLIENLMKLVDQCDDKSKQSTAKHLLDDLSSILKTTNKGAESQERPDNPIRLRPPQLIKRQGTFSIEKNTDDGSDGDKESPGTDYSKESIKADGEISPIDPGLSEVVKQIQNAFGSRQNVNVLQPMESSTTTAVNPTYIVVMTQPAADFGDNGEIQRFQRSRSQSLTLKEKPLAAIRAAQQKIEQSRVQCSQMSTPIKRPTLQRRSSFTTITRTTPNNEVKPAIPPVKPDAPKVIRRRSLQGPTSIVDTKQPAKEIEPAQIKSLNPVTRRRSFQGPSPPPGIRSPSPRKPSLNSNLIRPNQPLRLQCSTTGTLTRRKTMSNDLTNLSKDSPQKLKSSYGIMKKPPAPPATRNLKIRVSQVVSGRSTVPMRAIVPMNRVASKLLINETVSSIDDNKSSSLITSTPRSIPSPAKLKKGLSAGPSAPPEESPIPNLQKDRHLSMTPPKPSIQSTYNNAMHRRRTLSDYRSDVNNSVTVDSNANGKTVSSIKNATKTLASGLNKFKRMSGIGLKKPSSMGSKENKQP